MVTKVAMPKFGLSMEEGTIGSWLVKEGDEVKTGDALAEINSEKLTNEAEAPSNGVVRKILLPEGESAACGALICILADADEDITTACIEKPESLTPEAAPTVVAPVSMPTVAHGTVKITPRAQKIAEERGLEYTHITGTGIDGMITIDDLKRSGTSKAAAPVEAPAVPVPTPIVTIAPTATAPVSLVAPVYAVIEDGDEVIKMSPMQNAICKAMFSSMATSAQTTLATEANVQNLAKVYQSLKGKYTAAGLKLSYTAMLIKSVAQAMESHPKLRAQMVDDKHYKICTRIDIGVAVDVPNGLVVPVIRQANLKDLRTICAELSDLTARAKTGRLADHELGGAVTTITNLGMFNVTYFTPVLNAPESTILGVGSILQKPVARDGGIYLDSVMNLSLTHDHRILDGAPCARYLQEVVAGLQAFKWY